MEVPEYVDLLALRNSVVFGFECERSSQVRNRQERKIRETCHLTRLTNMAGIGLGQVEIRYNWYKQDSILQNQLINGEVRQPVDDDRKSDDNDVRASRNLEIVVRT